MKKILLLLAIISVTICHSINVDSLAKNISHDTTFIIQHPTSQDSVDVVQIVNSVATVSSVFVNPFIGALLKNNFIIGGIVGIILAIWRRIELRRLRKKGKLKIV